MKYKVFFALLLSVTLALSMAYFAMSAATTNGANPEAVQKIPKVLPARSPASAGVTQEPRQEPLSQLGMVTLEEAQRKVSFTIKIPNNLPPGFSLKATFASDLGPSTFKGVTYNVQTVDILFWDKEVSANLTAKGARNAGGIWVQQMYALGENSTKSYEGVVGDGSVMRATYLWGYPSIVGPNYLVTYHFGKHISYRIAGNYPEDVLMKIMESMVKG